MVRRMTDTDKSAENSAENPDQPEAERPTYEAYATEALADEPMGDRPTPDALADEPKGERIAKVLARAGVASRREVERMIEDGRIRIGGKILETPATLVTSLKGIMVDGEHITEVTQTKLWRFNKKRGMLTTHRDPEGRPTVFDKLPEHMGRVISVGRLDMNTEGLLLFTNDGELARWLELPVNSIVRKYRVRVYGRVSETALEKLKNGTTIDGVHYGEIDATLERQQGTNAWISMSIKEGKNREVRRVMESLGLVVNRLIRVSYGPFSLGTLEDGAVAPVGEKQLHEVLSGYFGDAPQAIGATETKRDPSKWAKAKKPTKVKLGAKRKRKFEAYRQGDADAPEMRRQSRGRPISTRRQEAQEKESQSEDRAAKRAAAGGAQRMEAPTKGRDGDGFRRKAPARGTNASSKKNMQAAADKRASNAGNTAGRGNDTKGSTGKPTAAKFSGKKAPYPGKLGKHSAKSPAKSSAKPQGKSAGRKAAPATKGPNSAGNAKGPNRGAKRGPNR